MSTTSLRSSVLFSRAPDVAAARRAVGASSGALAVGALPLFLVGALSTSIGDELGFGSAGTGSLVAAFFVTSGVTAVPVGWVTNRIGAPVAMRVGAALSGVAMLAVATVADSWMHVALSMAVGGVAIGFVDTASSEWFEAAVPGRRHGLAFGIKECSVPTASLLAGLSLPLVAETLGWRFAFGGGAALVVIVWFLVPTRPLAAPSAATVDDAETSWGPLVVFTVGIALGTAGATSGATFLVPALEDRGWGPSAAGFLLAAASVASIAARLTMGHATDRRSGSMWHLTAWCMVAGGLGAALLATPAPDVLVGVGAFAVLAFGWGWTGLAFHAVLTATRRRPALGAGLVLGGLSLGGAGGPAAFGAISESSSYAWSWAVAAAALVVAAACAATARWAMRRP